MCKKWPNLKDGLTKGFLAIFDPFEGDEWQKNLPESFHQKLIKFESVPR